MRLQLKKFGFWNKNFGLQNVCFVSKTLETLEFINNTCKLILFIIWVKTFQIKDFSVLSAEKGSIQRFLSNQFIMTWLLPNSHNIPPNTSSLLPFPILPTHSSLTPLYLATPLMWWPWTPLCCRSPGSSPCSSGSPSPAPSPGCGSWRLRLPHHSPRCHLWVWSSGSAVCRTSCKSECIQTHFENGMNVAELTEAIEYIRTSVCFRAQLP